MPRMLRRVSFQFFMIASGTPPGTHKTHTILTIFQFFMIASYYWGMGVRALSNLVVFQFFMIASGSSSPVSQ